MADLDRYFQKQAVPVDQMSLSVANTGGEKIGNALQGLGGALAGIAERDENFWVQKTLAEVEDASEREWETQVQNAPEDGMGFNDSYGGALAGIHSRAMENAPTRGARQKLDLALTQQRVNRSQRARGFEAQQKYNFRKNTIIREADNLAQRVFRDPGVAPYSPAGTAAAPAAETEDGEVAVVEPSGFYQAAPTETGKYEIAGFSSRFYSPRDFADGRNMADKTGGVKISKRLVSKLDWVTEQFGRGKLQINSGYRSPASNLRRASSGAHGPHTKGEAVDIQVRDLPQAEKNRLYSLLKSQGFNAFGFGHGALHAEIREGQGSGRGGDFEWTYGRAKKYQLVPVYGGAASATNAKWRSINQYPFIEMARLTARGETGRHNLVEASATVASDTNGSRSYGIFGINSGGTMQRFVDENPDLGLTAKPGSAEFDAQWAAAVKARPKAMIERQLKWHQVDVVRPAQRALVVNGLGKFSNDPRATAFVADMVVQYGRGGVQKHLLAAAGSNTVEQFIDEASRSMRSSLDGDFKSFLADNPEARRGLLNRIENRGRDALSLGPSTGPITGNVPLWNGPVPSIADAPGFAAQMERIAGMVETMGGTAADRAKVREQLTAQVTRSWLSSLAQTNPSAAMAALHSGRYDDVLSIGDEVALTGAAESGWKSYEKEIRTAHKALMENLQAETKKLVEDEAASLAATGRGIGALTPAHRAMMTDEDRERLELSRFEFDTTRTIKTARAEELPGILEQLEPSGEGFATEQKKFQFAAGLVEKRMKAQANDPAGYAVSVSEGVSKMWAEAMRSNDPAQIQSAIRALRGVQRAQGVRAGSVRSITQTSAAHNAELLSPENPDQAFANFLQMRSLYGPEFGAVLEEMERDGGVKGWADVNRMADAGQVVLAKSLARVVHRKEFDPGVAVGVALADQGDPATARRIFDGKVRRLELNGVSPTGKSDDGEDVDEIVGRTLGDALALSPSAMSAVREAAVNLYADGAGIGEALDGDKMEEAVKAVTGGILEYNGSGKEGRFVAPVVGMTQDMFDRMAWQIKDKDLAGAFVGYGMVGSEVTAGMLRSELQFVSAGNGSYFLRYPGAGLARDNRGAPFVLDLRAMLPELMERAKNDRSIGPTPADTVRTADDQKADIEGAADDGTLSVEDEARLRSLYGPLWGFRDGEFVGRRK